MKKDSFSKKSLAVFSRNYLRMHQLFWDHKRPSEFIGAVISIRKILGIFEDLNFKDIYREANGDIKKFNALEDKYQKDKADFLKSNGYDKAALRKGVVSILRKNGLGEEWEEMIILAIITGACLPPMYNVSISRDTEKETLTFTINRNTSKNDLDVAWKYTSGIRESMFGDTRRATYPTKKTFSNHNEYVKAITQKISCPEITEDDGGNEGARVRKTSDKDIVAILYPSDEDIDLKDSGKNDRNRLNKMRVNRHRQKK